MTICESHLEAFVAGDRLVKAFEHWVVCVRAKQVTLGSCVILLRRSEASIAGLSDAEAVGLVEAIRWFEARARSAFGAERFNYVAAMMKDAFVHFHAFPRYSAVREAGGVTWKDEYWPKAVTLADVTTGEDVVASIGRILREPTAS